MAKHTSYYAWTRTHVRLLQDISYLSAFTILPIVSVLRVGSDVLYHHHVRSLLRKEDTRFGADDDGDKSYHHRSDDDSVQELPPVLPPEPGADYTDI